MLLNWRINNSRIVSVCSLDKLARIDIPAARNMRILCLQAYNLPVLAVKVRVLVWNRNRIQSIANIRVATSNRVRALFLSSLVTPHLAISSRDKRTDGCERSHLEKYCLFYLVLPAFTRTSFRARNPLTSAFWVFNFWCACCDRLKSPDITVPGGFSPPWMPGSSIECNNLGSKYQTVRIGSCKDLPDCSLSHKKWKLFSIICQELGKLASS